ncbi:methyltransferase domain-containing protein [Mariniluteicoccus flavus]
MGDWDPTHYLAYADERGRPFHDLMARVGAASPGLVVDLGCGPANLTVTLAERWPDARVVGVDSSAAMLERARTGAPTVEVVQADLREWRADGPVDVLVSNATLQWIPDWPTLLPDLVTDVVPGGWVAFQVPRNWDQPNHVLMRELGEHPRFAPHLEGVARTRMVDTTDVMRRLHGLGFVVDGWETTYLHVLQGEDAVFDWISSTGARPTLDALPAGLREEYAEDYKALLRRAYPKTELGTVLPFPRSFVVGRRGS